MAEEPGTAVGDNAPRLTLATKLTLLRIGCSILVLPVILSGQLLLAALVIVLAGATDWLDGYLARSRGEVTPLGTALDPIADKLLTLTVLIGFIALGTVSGAALLPAAAILWRETLVSGLREATKGESLAVSPLAKWKTAAQFVAFIALCLGSHPALTAPLWIAGALTLWTGADYAKKFWSTYR